MIRKNLSFKKKGNFADIPTFIMTALVIGIGLILTLLIINNFNDNIQANPSIDNVTKSGSQEYYTLLETSSDYILPVLYFGFLAFSVFSARLIPSSPKFMIIGILALIFLPLVAMMIENIWDGFIQQTTTQQQADGLIFTPFLLNNLTFATFIYTIAVLIALFSKEDALIR